MTKIVDATFNGSVFCPQSPVDLDQDKLYKLTIEEAPQPRQTGESAWDVLDRLTGTVEGPEDWSENHDHYRLGTPKRSKSGI